jgi:CHAT domain-containing protein
MHDSRPPGGSPGDRFSWEGCQHVRAGVEASVRTIGRRCLVIWLMMTSIAQAQILDGRTVPGTFYELAFQPFHRGEYRDSLKGFRSAASSGINTGAGRWVDSICYFTMTGECFYHLGDLSSALDQYDAALQLTMAHRGWLKRVQLLPPVIGPLATPARVPWGPTTRNAVPGGFPATMQILQGTNLDTVLRQGGTYQAPELYPVRVLEIMRCTALALRRRREILGPLARQLPLTNQLVKEFSLRQVPANHWMQTLIDVQRGIAMAAEGDRDDALQLLQRSLLVNGRFDHPLTAIALLEIGDLALEKNDLDMAQRSYFEASYPAAHFGQADALEEALVGAARIHTFKGDAGIFAPLTTAADWGRAENLDRAASAILLVATEHALFGGDAKQAARLLTQARAAMGRSDLRGADLGVESLYQTAQLALDGGGFVPGMKALADAHRLHRPKSRRLFQLELINQLYSSKEFSPRVAGLLLTELLREPTAQDWQQDRHETLLLEATPHLQALERWLEITLDRSTGGNLDTLVLVTEAIRRHKFFSQLPMAGRLLALRWVLEAPERLLDEASRNQRQNLLTRYPDIAQRSRQMKDLTAQLSQLPVIPDSGEPGRVYDRVSSELARLADEQEAALLRLALRPEPATRLFPPLLPLEQIQNRMGDGQGILAFTVSDNQVQAILLTPDQRYKTWLLNAPAQMRSDLAALMRAIGNHDAKQAVLAERLTSDNWKGIAAALFAPLAEGLTPETLASLKELVIVPDGFLWYLPFELLQVGDESEATALIDIVPLRYAPTMGLAVQDPRPKEASGSRVIVHGRMFSREMDQVLATAAEQLQAQQAPSAILRRRLPLATRYVASVWQQLIVLDDIEGAQRDPLNWAPAQIDQGKPGGALSDWLALPWGAPDVVVLPGYSTSADSGLRGGGNGDELLVATCGLMAAGTRTVVLSRWRTGGRSNLEVVREFLQELPVQSAAAAWQRSLLLARSSELDLSAEPRLKNIKPGEVPTADHPFFWAGYLLIGAW